MRTNYRRLLPTLFAQLATALKWNAGPAYIEGRPQIGATFLARDSVYGWSIGRIVNATGGESRLKESCTSAEMESFLRGALFAVRYAAPKHPQPWSSFSVPGGWQTRDAAGELFGPVFNETADLWNWQRAAY